MEVRRQGLPFSIIRWVANPEEVDVPKLTLTHDTLRVENMRGEKLLLFTSEWNLSYCVDHNPNLELSEFGNVTFKKDKTHLFQSFFLTIQVSYNKVHLG